MCEKKNVPYPLLGRQLISMPQRQRVHGRPRRVLAEPPLPVDVARLVDDEVNFPFAARVHDPVVCVLLGAVCFFIYLQ